MKISKTFVGRERKGQATFSPLVLLRGSGGGRKTVAGKMTESGRAQVARSGGMKAEVFRLPQEHGRTHRYPSSKIYSAVFLSNKPGFFWVVYPLME